MNVPYNRTDQNKLTQDMDKLFKKHKKKSKKKNDRFKNDNSKKHNKHQEKLKHNKSSENISSKTDINENQQLQHVKGSSAVADTSGVNKYFPVDETTHQNKKGLTNNNDNIDGSRSDSVMERKLIILKGETEKTHESNGSLESMSTSSETNTSNENKIMKINVRPRSAMTSQTEGLTKEMSYEFFTKSKSTLETTSINTRPESIKLQANNFMPVNA